jgi:hypothetical protein
VEEVCVLTEHNCSTLRHAGDDPEKGRETS